MTKGSLCQTGDALLLRRDQGVGATWISIAPLSNGIQGCGQVDDTELLLLRARPHVAIDISLRWSRRSRNGSTRGC